MYAQVEKPKQNKSRAIANSITQKKSNVKQGFQFIDNRAAVIVQRKLLVLNNMPKAESKKATRKKEGGIHKNVMQMRALYRFINPAAEDIKNIRARRLLNDYEYQQLIRDETQMGVILAAHMMGNTDNSPFISLTTDFNLAAQTTDTSPGGLGSIVHNAPNIAIFDVPDEYVIAAGGGGLQEGEGEVLVLLPPGKSLSDYLTSLAPNIYRRLYWNAENLE